MASDAPAQTTNAPAKIRTIGGMSYSRWDAVRQTCRHAPEWGRRIRADSLLNTIDLDRALVHAEDGQMLEKRPQRRHTFRLRKLYLPGSRGHVLIVPSR